MAPILIVWGYIDIYRRKEYVGGATGAHEVGARPWGAPSTLVTASGTSWSRVQVSWITFGEKIMFPKIYIPFGLSLIFRLSETLK